MPSPVEAAGSSGTETEGLRAVHRLDRRFRFHGHAIVSADDCIAGPDGLTPKALRNEADWVRFQAMLDAAAVTVLGRLGHEANPNVARRRRLVLTGGVAALEADGDNWLWNPAGLPLGQALERVLPPDIHRSGGVLAVPGGRRVFDFFLKLGYDEFHLARAERATVGRGTRLFSGLDERHTAVDALLSAGLVPGAREVLDGDADVSLTIWRPPAAGS
ncbi:hypothetical protein [Microbaculum marinum]|uniref:Uncharacterized protein n=1 Tax=Microbaculum marinum TaxID=1764581 RepID=A0AAW9RZN4_9HYPH